jgi:hypothetical protein
LELLSRTHQIFPELLAAGEAPAAGTAWIFR